MSERLSGQELTGSPDVFDGLSDLREVAYRVGYIGKKTANDRAAQVNFEIVGNELFAAIDDGVVEWPEIESLPSSKRELCIYEAARIVTAWEKSHQRDHRLSPFSDPEIPIEQYVNSDFERLDVRLLLANLAQTAIFIGKHGVMPGKPIIPLVYYSPEQIEDFLRPSNAPEDDLGYYARKLALHTSPRRFKDYYAKIMSHLNYDLDKIAAEADLSPEECSDILSAGTVRRIARRTPDSFDANIVLFLKQVSSITPELVGSEMGIEASDIAQILSRSDIITFVHRNPNNPMPAIYRYIQTMTEDLSSKNMAAHLSIDEDKVDEVVPKYARRYVALRYRHPFEQIQRGHKKANELEGRGLPTGLARLIAFKNSIQTADIWCNKLLASLGHRPQKVSPDIWLYANFRHERDPNKRDRMIAEYYLYLQLKNPLSLDANNRAMGEDGRSRYEIIGDNRYDPAEMLFENDVTPERELTELARQANITPKQIATLMEAYESGDPSQLTTEQCDILKQLQSFAQFQKTPKQAN